MVVITTQFRGSIKFNSVEFSKSKIEVQARHATGWKKVFEFTAEDMIKLFSKSKKRKIK